MYHRVSYTSKYFGSCRGGSDAVTRLLLGLLQLHWLSEACEQRLRPNCVQARPMSIVRMPANSFQVESREGSL